MTAFYRSSTITLTLTALVFASGCATKRLPVEGYTPTVDISRLERDDSESPTIIYQRPGGPELGEFDRFILDPVKIHYDDPDMDELSAEQVGRVQQYLLDAMTRELTDAGYTVGTKSEAGKYEFLLRFRASGRPPPRPT